MTASGSGEMLRAALFHTPGNPFLHSGALASEEDGALLLAGGRIAVCGDYEAERRRHPDVPVRDLRGGVRVPGFIDTHVRYPQTRVIGGIRYSLLEWLETNTRPEEVKFSGVEYAKRLAGEFVHALLSPGTTMALVFGAPVYGAQPEAASV